MSKQLHRNHRSWQRSGAILPLVAVVIVVLFVAAALALDIAHVHLTRSQLRTATDAAARAAIEALGREQDLTAAENAAIETASRNLVAGKGLTLDRSDIQFGGAIQQDDGSFQFDPDARFVNSVRVVGQRVAGSPDGPVNLLFGPMFNVAEFEPVQSATAARLDRDIALVLDVSGSMRRDRRFDGLKDALDVFLRELEESPQEERVSLSVYSTRASQLTLLDNNLNRIRSAFATQSPGGRTAIGEGLRRGIQSLRRDPNRRDFALKSIIVMTDGNHNQGINPRAVAAVAKSRDITVHTITFSSGANQSLMKQTARSANGIHIHANNNAQLVTAFREIARQLSVVLTE